MTSPLLTLAAAASEPSFFERLWNFLGTFHPATIHFPIAMITFAAICIVVRIATHKIPLDVPFFALCFGALTAPAAAVMGWSFASWRGMGNWNAGMDAEIFWHRWTGVAVAVFSLIVMAMAIRARLSGHPGHHRVWQIGVLLLAGLVGWTGHQGGSLIYGEDLYARPWQGPVQITVPVDAVPPKNGQIDFVLHIAPIFEQVCIKCHGPDKDKGDLRLHTRPDLLKGGKMQSKDPAAFTSVVPGDPDKSYLIELLTLDDPDEMMPPKSEGGPLKPEQIDLIRQWIEQGAMWPAGVELKEVK